MNKIKDVALGASRMQFELDNKIIVMENRISGGTISNTQLALFCLQIMSTKLQLIIFGGG